MYLSLGTVILVKAIQEIPFVLMSRCAIWNILTLISYIHSVRMLSHEDEDHMQNTEYADGCDYDWDGEYYEHNSAAYDDCR